MDPISPLLADAFRLPRMDLYGHLDEAEYLASRAVDWSDEDIATARKLIPDLVIVIRRAGDGAPGAAQWRLPDLPVGVAMPGGDDDSRAGEGSHPGIRRARLPGT